MVRMGGFKVALTIESILGRIGDLDSHEAISTNHYPKLFGEVGQRFLDELPELWERVSMGGTAPEELAHRLTFPHEDLTPITAESVWTVKGCPAPGVIDMTRRPLAMNEMGIQRQLVFPMMGILAWVVAQGGGQGGFPVPSPAQKELGRRAIEVYNEWAGRVTRQFQDRLWVVGILDSGADYMTPELLLQKAKEMMAQGCRAIMISAGEPPAGISPGDSRIDPFYELLTSQNITLTFHPPSSMNFRRSEVWESAMLDPRYYGVTAHAPAEPNFIASMILSGVFDRHPKLRVAVVESGAHWVGPLSEYMDFGVCLRADHSKLAMKPSGYLARNVRVSVMVEENVELWLERWPHLRNVYCYSSDYPHAEGGEWSLKRMFERIALLGDEVTEKFFVSNSRWVLPEA
jgi:predicted TIM-barrel fold metal-dependent hydrolase